MKLIVKWLILGFLVNVCGGCADNATSIQPVASFYALDVQRKIHAETILSLASMLAKKNGMKFYQTESRDGDISFYATKNSWLYHHALAPGRDADFDVYISSRKITIHIVGPPEHPRVHRLISEWEDGLVEAGVKYGKVVRQYYLGNEVTPKDDPRWKEMHS